MQPLELHRAVVPDGVLVSKPPINQLDWCPCRRTLDVQHILQLQITVRDASRVRIPHPPLHAVSFTAAGNPDIKTACKQMQMT